MKDELVPIEKIRDYKVTKSNFLIQTARSSMTASEMRVLVYAISKIELGDKQFNPCEISITEFANVCGITPDAQYSNLKEVTTKLKGRVIEFFEDEEMDSFLQTTWLRYVRYRKGKGVVTLLLEEELAPHLLELRKNFTSYGLKNILLLRSKYAMQMYEILKSYENLGAWCVGLENLKKLLFAEQYERFPDFRRKVLEIAVLEINEKTDISANYKLTKKGKKVIGIEFTIKTNFENSNRLNKIPIDNETKEKTRYALLKQLMSLPRSLTKREKELGDKWLDEYESSFDLIKLAHERTVEYIGKTSAMYMDKILFNWHDKKIETIEDAENEQVDRMFERDKASGKI